MPTYKVVIDKMEWTGGDRGYGTGIERKEFKKSFPSQQAALKYAYEIVNKSQKKAKNQYTTRITYSVDLVYGTPIRTIFGVQLHAGKIRVWTTNPANGYFLGYLLNKDGTINWRSGIQ